MASAPDYHILTTTTLDPEHTRILKHGDLFLVCDRYGDMPHSGRTSVFGLYREDTRHLSRYHLRLFGARPLLLSSAIAEDNTTMSVDLTNPEVVYGNQTIAADTLHIYRTRVLWRSTMLEQIHLHHFGSEPVRVPLTLDFDADYADVFEVRGIPRTSRGTVETPTVEVIPPGQIPGALPGPHARVTHRYGGCDNLVRLTNIRLSPAPDLLTPHRMTYTLDLAPGERTVIEIVMVCAALPRPNGRSERDASPVPVPAPAAASYTVAQHQLTEERENARKKLPVVSTSNNLFNQWIWRSQADLMMLTAPTPHGPYPHAGTPWYSAVFGRDGIITALQTLWLAPELARGVLAHLAHTQAHQTEEVRDAEPGKIVHEIRHGEMARTGEVPFGRYYGTVDATPLFIMLAQAYLRRTNDVAWLQALWPSILSALDWMDHHAARRADGYLRYDRHHHQGLLHQGWKDSHDSVFHADGRAAKAPIALCEVQGYAYAARRAAADIAMRLGRQPMARDQLERAAALREHFARDFWMPEMGTFALALDGEDQPCRVATSNAGHTMFTGVASSPQASQLAQTLMGPEFFTGWGIRTLSSQAPRYNPLSYHNGSVWPHDTALIALGLSQYDRQDLAALLLHGMFRAARHIEFQRLPELFCGFDRRPGHGPTPYPVACSPQAWAAGAVFMLLQATLGLEIDATTSRVRFRRPAIPRGMDRVELRNLRVGEARIDCILTGREQHVRLDVVEHQGHVDVELTG